MWFVFLIPCLLASIYVIYQRVFHPLAKVPGPFWASITPLWLAWQGYNTRRPRLDLDLHRRYGSVVRIAPDEIIFSNPAYFGTVYGAGTKFQQRGRLYEAMVLNPQPDTWDRLGMLTESNVERLRFQKRLLGPAYTTANAKKHEGLIDNNLRRWLKRLDGLVDRPLDIYPEFELLNVDIMTELTFARPFGAVDAGDDGHNMEDLHQTFWKSIWIGYLPTFNAISKMIPWSLFFKGPAFPVFAFCMARMMESERASTAGQVNEACIHSDLRNLMGEKPALRPTWVQHISMTNLGAGVDTTSWTLATTLVGISQDARISARVRDEIDTAIKQGHDIRRDAPVPFDAAARLPYLQACMHEAMRMWPNIAPSLPRLVPAHGDGIVMDGHRIPAGCAVGMNSRQLGRAEEVFGPEPDVFRPERWLDVDERRWRDMQTRNLAFGAPSRRCVGMHVAWVSMSKVVATLFANFESQVLNRLDGEAGPGGDVWREVGTFPTKWTGLEVQLKRR